MFPTQNFLDVALLGGYQNIVWGTSITAGPNDTADLVVTRQDGTNPVVTAHNALTGIPGGVSSWTATITVGAFVVSKPRAYFTDGSNYRNEKHLTFDGTNIVWGTKVFNGVLQTGPGGEGDGDNIVWGT